MCKFFSGIITNKNKTVLWDMDQDSHSFLLEKHKIKDETESPKFVRVELLPQDGDKFNHDVKNWKLHVGQDFKPDWFDENLSEKLMRKKLQELIEARFVIGDKKWRKLEGGRFWVKNSSVVARENSSVNIPYSTEVKIKSIHDLASVKDIPHKKILVANKDFTLEVIK